MLKHLQKFFKGPEGQSQEEDVNMTDQDKATLAAAETEAAELSVALEAANATLADLQTKFDAITAQYETAQAALNASQEAQAALAAQAAEKRLKERTEAIKAAVGTEKVEALLAATDGMADEQFNVIVSAMAASFDAEAQTPAFQETGVAAEAPVVDEKKPTHFNQFIKKGN